MAPTKLFPAAHAALLLTLSAAVAAFVAVPARHAPAKAVPPALAASLDASGTLVSLKAGGTEILGAPLEFCPGVPWTTDRIDTGPDGKDVRVALKSDQGNAGMAYNITPDRVSITLRHRIGGYQGWQLPLGDDVVAVENLQDNTVSGSEALEYLEEGEIRPLPLRLPRVQRARLYLRNGLKVLFWHDGWGAPFNLDEIGGFNGRVYRRNLVESNHPMRIYFELETPRPGAPLLPLGDAPAFVPTGAAVANMFYEGEPVRFDLKFTEATLARLEASGQWRLSWTVRDFHHRVTERGKDTFNAADALARKSVSVNLPVRECGWFSVLFSISPVALSPSLPPSQFRARFAVVGRHPALPARPEVSEAGKLSDYAYAGLIGLRGMRERFMLRGLFPEKGRADWKKLDAAVDRAAAEAKRWGASWFFQANERPQWCSPEDYEQIAFDLVSRYKDRCSAWEVENEPNFRMSPEDYVRKCLVPFAKGAKRADPACQVIGPGCVSLPETLRFVQAIVDAGALRCLDGVSTHAYVGPGEPWEFFGNPGYLRRLQELAGDRPLWQTEGGYNWANPGRQVQARYAVRQFLNAFAAGIPDERQYYFYPVQHGFEPWYLVEMNANEGVSGTLEPAAVALRILHEQVAGLSAGKTEQPLPGLYRLRFSGEKEDVVALWTLDYAIDVTLRGKVLGSTDFMGAESRTSSADAPMSLTLDGYPVYLHVPHGGKLEIAGPRFGTNVALLSQGAAAGASSAAPGRPAEAAIDGLWAGRDKALDLPQRTFWEPARPVASPDAPCWIQVDFPVRRTLSRALVVTAQPAVECTPRDFALQVSTHGKVWRTVAESRSQAAVASLLTFRPVAARHARLLVTAVNDGWQKDGRWRSMVRQELRSYTDLRPRVSELMLFGP